MVQAVTDAAAYGPRVAPGSLATIFGTGLASGTDSASAFPLPTTLDGASVTMGGISAPLVYASPTQINFQVPSSVQSGSVALVVNGPGGASASFTVTVTASAPALFQSSVNGSSAPAASGSVISVYLTGIGAVNNAVADGTPASASPLETATATFSATIGVQSATVQFLGRAPGYAGLDQANIQVPTLPSGSYPLVITVGGYLSASATISVSGSGTYTSPLQLTGSAVFGNSLISSIALYSNVAYVCGTNHITMVDVSSLTSPTVIGSFGDSTFGGYGVQCSINATASTPFLVEIFGNSINPQSFAIYGLSNPRAPNLLVVANTSYPNMVGINFTGNYAFVNTNYLTYYVNGHGVIAQNGQFLVFNFTNPASPSYIGMLQPAAQNLTPYALVFGQSGYAYIASSTATGSNTAGTGVLDVISIASPTVPTQVNQVQVSQASILLRLDISGTTLLAAGNTMGQRNPGNPDFDFLGNLTLTTMDVTNPQAPVVINTAVYTTQVNGTLSLEAFNSGVFGLVNAPPSTDNFGPASLQIVDARQPSNILLYPVQAQFGFSGILTTTNGYVMAPTSLGLNIYQLRI